MVGLGLVFALAWKRGWLLDQVYRLPFIARRAAEAIEKAEDAAEDIVGIVSLGEAQALLPWKLLSWASVTAAPCTTFCAATS